MDVPGGGLGGLFKETAQGALVQAVDHFELLLLGELAPEVGRHALAAATLAVRARLVRFAYCGALRQNCNARLSSEGVRRGTVLFFLWGREPC